MCICSQFLSYAYLQKWIIYKTKISKELVDLLFINETISYYFVKIKFVASPTITERYRKGSLMVSEGRLMRARPKLAILKTEFTAPVYRCDEGSTLGLPESTQLFTVVTKEANQGCQSLYNCFCSWCSKSVYIRKQYGGSMLWPPGVQGVGGVEGGGSNVGPVRPFAGLLQTSQFLSPTCCQKL